MRYRLQTFFGTFYADTEREIRDLQGMFRGLGHNVRAEFKAHSSNTLESRKWEWF